MSNVPYVLCPECSSEDVECLSTTFFLFRCLECNERFSQEDAIALQERSSRFRTKPRRYEDDD